MLVEIVLVPIGHVNGIGPVGHRQVFERKGIAVDVAHIENKRLGGHGLQLIDKAGKVASHLDGVSSSERANRI